MLTAAKVFYPPRSEMPAPAFTDHSHIFICKEADNGDRSLLLRHEQAHIWLNHKTRKPDCENLDRAVWTIALEMEIARNFYTKEDEARINRPFSALKGGYVSDTFKKMPPEIKMAEDIYQWLIDNPDERPDVTNFCVCRDCDENEGNEGDEGNEESESSPSAKDIEEIEDGLKKIALDVTSEKYNKQLLEKKKPSLASEIDYILRSKKVRNRTFMRESRRQVEGVILKGARKLKKSPRVEIFVDRSGSMSGEKTGASVEKLKRILRKYKASVRNDVFYFSSGKIYSHDIPPNGGNPYPLVMAHIEKSKPQIAVIITDYDLEETADLKPLSHSETKILCVPVCAERTAISHLIGAKEVT
jgi:predicted metal-dependent peptidase